MRAPAGRGLRVWHELDGLDAHALGIEGNGAVKPWMLRSIRVQGLVLGLGVGQPKADRIRQGLWGWQMPVQDVTTLQQSKARQGEAIATAQGLLAVALAGPEVLRRQHANQCCTIAEHQHVGALEEHAQVGAASIHITDHRLQRGRQLTPVAGSQHPREGAQGIAEEP